MADHIEPSVDKSLNVGDDTESAAAIDKAFSEATGGVPEGAPEDAAPVDVPAVEDEGLPEQQAPSEEPVEETPAPTSRVPETPPATVEEDPVMKALNALNIRSDASQKTKDTFANLKQISSEGLKAARAEVARLKAEQQKVVEEARKAALEEAAKTAAVPEDVQKELEDLRRLRARVDVESDPKFKEQFDSKKEANYEEIYGVLAQFGLKPSELKVLRGLSEEHRLENITEMAAKLPPGSRLKIEAKLFDNLNISDSRDKALKDAREAAQKLHAEKETLTKSELEAQTREREQAVAQFKANELFKKIEIPANTPGEERKRLEASNQFVDKLQKLFDETVADERPFAKVEAAYGLVLAHKFKADADAANAKATALQKELDGIKKRSGVSDKGRLVNVPSDKSSRPASTDFDAGASLDSLAKEFGVA